MTKLLMRGAAVGYIVFGPLILFVMGTVLWAACVYSLVFKTKDLDLLRIRKDLVAGLRGEKWFWE